VAARIALAFAFYGLLSGILSLLGWALDLQRLTDWEGDGISIQPNASLAAAAIGAALVLAMLGRNRAASIIAGVTAALGVLTAFENLSGVDVGIDRLLLFNRDWGAVGTTAPGRMGVPASLSYAVLGACLLLMRDGTTAFSRELAPWLALLPLAISTLSILGYLYNASLLYSIPGITAIALQTATYVFALAIATIVRTERGPMRLFGDSGPAGIAARLLLPFIFAVPVVTGAIRLTGERAGLYDTGFGVALHNLVEIALLLAVIWWAGRSIMRHSEQRQQAESERQELLVSEQAARREAERQATIRDEFLATLSHELRTPLNAILGWAQVLKIESADANRIDQAVEVIERNARLQAQLIADLLDMSRILAGKMRVHVQPLDLAAVTSAAIDVVRPAAEAKSIRIEQVLEPIGNVINGDGGRLQQAVWNLLTNAVKFTPRGGKVQVVLARVNSHVEIRVSDSGEGIDAEFLPKIFQRFRQADASTARQHGGLGLGLALVKQLVEIHGGRIAATSEGLGKGATFTLALPLAIMQPHHKDERVHPLAATLQPTAELPPSLDGLSLLIVDDDADSLQMVANLFEDRGATVVTSTNAGDALDIAVAQRFDAIVSDIGMPGRDGYAFIQDLRARGVTVPAVALTAYARSEDRTKALSSGYQSHIAKPVEAAELLATIAALTRRLRGQSPA
jgi:signal transduction histidine kinase/CheY-like chemotaxis protein